MKLFLVWGIEFHEMSQLLGIYDSIEKANIRLCYLKEHETYFDDFKVKEIEINSDLE